MAALGVYASIKTDKAGKKIDAENDALLLKIDSLLDSILMDVRKFNKEIDSLNKEIEKWQ